MHQDRLDAMYPLALCVLGDLEEIISEPGAMEGYSAALLGPEVEFIQ